MASAIENSITSSPVFPGSVLSVRIQEKRFGAVPILGALTFDVEPNQIVVVLGPSGSGKTTLLRVLAGLDRDFAGNVQLGRSPIVRPTSQIALMFQDVRLLPWMTVERNIRFAVAASQHARSPEESVRVVGLDPAILQYYPRQLSGGMAKRVALARALAGNPSMLLLDEPFSELDIASKYKLYDLLIESIHSPNVRLGAIMVSHDITEAVYLADKILMLSVIRPAVILSTVLIDLPRPRHREDPEFLKLCTSLMISAISNADSAANSGLRTEDQL